MDNNMTKQEQAEQLRLAAEIIERGLEWEMWRADNIWRDGTGEPFKAMIEGYYLRIKPKPDPYAELKTAHAKGEVIQYKDCIEGEWIDNPSPQWTEPVARYRVKPPLTLLQPPLGLILHNPDNLTAKQVGEGYRLLATTEVDGRHSDLPTLQIWTQQRTWGCTGDLTGNCQFITYRVPASTPWPDPPKQKKLVQLGPEDVPPGSVICANNDKTCWLAILAVNEDRVFYNGLSHVTYEELFKRWEIKRPSEDWQPCSKEIEV